MWRRKRPRSSSSSNSNQIRRKNRGSRKVPRLDTHRLLIHFDDGYFDPCPYPVRLLIIHETRHPPVQKHTNLKIISRFLVTVPFQPQL